MKVSDQEDSFRYQRLIRNPKKSGTGHEKTLIFET